MTKKEFINAQIGTKVVWGSYVGTINGSSRVPGTNELVSRSVYWKNFGEYGELLEYKVSEAHLVDLADPKKFTASRFKTEDQVEWAYGQRGKVYYSDAERVLIDWNHIGRIEYEHGCPLLLNYVDPVEVAQ